MTVEENLDCFDPEFVTGMLEGIIRYLKSCGCTSYETSSIVGWKVALKEKRV